MRRLFLALLVATAVVSGCAPGARPATVEITMRYSHFSPSRLEVPRGRPITVVLKNEDPIDHEWIVGDAALHERHRSGTEKLHDSIPSEVTVPALSTKITTLSFDTPGELFFACHLPGHERYGMVGMLQVTR